MKVILSGGLGNQLFQWSFGHFLFAHSGLKADLVFFRGKNDVLHTNISLLDFIEECKHCRPKIWERSFLNKLFNPWNRTNPQRANLLPLVDLRSRPFENLEGINTSSNMAYIGYFQNSNIVLAVREVILPELEEMINKKSILPKNLNKGEFLEVIHIRRGDTIVPNIKKRVGILDLDYYKAVLGDRNLKNTRIVVTDDESDSKSLVNNLRADAVFSSRELDPISTLHLMSKAKKLVTANSTFSWWGGILANKNGAEVIIPKPFFASPELSADKALNYPGFVQAKSIFMI